MKQCAHKINIRSEEQSERKGERVREREGERETGEYMNEISVQENQRSLTLTYINL